MQKLYTAAFVLLQLARFAVAQNACPGPNPPAVRNITYIVAGQPVCVVFVEHMIPNAPVSLFGANLTTIGTASGDSVATDASGFASFVYSCNHTPQRVVTCINQGCCAALVPPAAFLPVKLTRFMVLLQSDNSAALSWTSAVEVNSKKYVVERSEDGRTFRPVGDVSASGNSSRPINYSFTDKLPASGAYFYRLQQVDLDAKFEHSRVVYLNNRKGYGGTLKVFPNPFQNEVQLIGISSADLNAAHVKVYNPSGQSVPYTLAGANAITLGAAAKGIYILEVNGQRFKLIRN